MTRRWKNANTSSGCLPRSVSATSGQRKSFHEPMTVNSEYRPRHGQHDTTQQHQRAGTVQPGV
jgi:hypothetical protein